MRALLLTLTLIACRKDEAVDTSTPSDGDGDGVLASEDCDDGDPSVGSGYPWYADNDGDGYGDPALTQTACTQPYGYTDNQLDCDDSSAQYQPGAIESDCSDPNDYNCDGSVGYADADADGFPACEDCDDSTSTVNPEATELCNEVDDDCSGEVDEDASDATTWYGDADGDGYGGDRFTELACEAPSGFVSNADDCDDLDELSNPGASERCDEQDNNCDGEVDEGAQLTFYQDTDGDGYGDPSYTGTACEEPPGYADNNTDCDDSDAANHPGALEVCDSSDNDCDGDTDEGALDADTWYTDADSDGWGDASLSQKSCSQPSGAVENNDDCDDSASSVNPGEDELCDSIDNDCDGDTDESSAIDAITTYLDNDKDGYGGSASLRACTASSGYVSSSGDCDDSDSAVSPGSSESCDSVDNDCDGTIDNEADVAGEGEDCAAVDCADLSSTRGSLSDGSYWLDPDGTGAFEGYCDFSSSGGPYSWLVHDDIQAYWTFNESNQADATYGGFTGTGTNTTRSSTVVSADFDDSVYFSNGDSNYLTLSTGVTFGSSSTLMFWARIDSCSNNKIPILMNDGSSYIGDLQYRTRVYLGSTSVLIGSNVCSSWINTWNHHAYVDDGSSIRVWVNGVEETSFSSYSYKSFSGYTVNRFGNKPGFGTNGLSGYLDEVVFFKRALTEEEIQRVYEGGSSYGHPLRF